MSQLAAALNKAGLAKQNSPASRPSGGSGRSAHSNTSPRPVISLRNLRVGDVLYRDDVEVGYVQAISAEAVTMKFDCKPRPVDYYLDHCPPEQGDRIKGLRFSEHQCQCLGLTSILGEFRTAHFNPRSPR